MLKWLEETLFIGRATVLLVLGALTLYTLYHSARTTADIDWRDHAPGSHPLVESVERYQGQSPGVNPVMITLTNEEGTIWNADTLRKLQDLTDEAAGLPFIVPQSIQSLWTLNRRTVASAGRPVPLIGKDAEETALTSEHIKTVRARAAETGIIGTFVSEDEKTALIVAELAEPNRKARRLQDPSLLEEAFQELAGTIAADGQHRTEMLSPSGLTLEIAKEGQNGLIWIVLGLLLTAFVIALEFRSFVFGLGAIATASLCCIWTIGIWRAAVGPLDPFALLFLGAWLVFVAAQTVLHDAVITKRLEDGDTALEAAKASFAEISVPAGFASIICIAGVFSGVGSDFAFSKLMPWLMAIALVGGWIAAHVVWPLSVSYVSSPERLTNRVFPTHSWQEQLIGLFRVFADKNVAAGTLCICALISIPMFLLGGNWGPRDAYPYSSHLTGTSVHNTKAAALTTAFPGHRPIFPVAFETPPDGCVEFTYLNHQDKFGWYMQAQPEVANVRSLAQEIKDITAELHGGDLRWHAIPRNSFALIQTVGTLPDSSTLMNEACTVLPVQLTLTDGAPDTVDRTLQAIQSFRAKYPEAGAFVRPVGGPMALSAATAEVVAGDSHNGFVIFIWVSFFVAMGVFANFTAAIAVTLSLVFGYASCLWLVSSLGMPPTAVSLLSINIVLAITTIAIFVSYSMIEQYREQEMRVRDAVRHALHDAGNGMVALAALPALSYFIWVWSGFATQSQLGVYLGYGMMLSGLCALVIAPAIAASTEWLTDVARAADKKEELPVFEEIA